MLTLFIAATQISNNHASKEVDEIISILNQSAAFTKIPLADVEGRKKYLVNLWKLHTYKTSQIRHGIMTQFKESKYATRDNACQVIILTRLLFCVEKLTNDEAIKQLEFNSMSLNYEGASTRTWPLTIKGINIKLTGQSNGISAPIPVGLHEFDLISRTGRRRKSVIID